MALTAPKGSANMKSSEKGVGTSIHQFSFSKVRIGSNEPLQVGLCTRANYSFLLLDQVFGPQSTQAELFEDTVKSQVSEFLDGKNALIFSYGVTNAGKTFTIQGKWHKPSLSFKHSDALKI